MSALKMYLSFLFLPPTLQQNGFFQALCCVLACLWHFMFASSFALSSLMVWSNKCYFLMVIGRGGNHHQPNNITIFESQFRFYCKLSILWYAECSVFLQFITFFFAAFTLKMKNWNQILWNIKRNISQYIHAGSVSFIKTGWNFKNRCPHRAS